MADKTIPDLDAVATVDVTGSTVFEVQVPGLAAPESRKVTLDQLRALVPARAGQTRIFTPRPKVGATAGWVVGAADNQNKLATLPASQTSATLVVPVGPLKVGETVTGFAVQGSIQSAGNTGTINADLRKMTAAAAGATDTSVLALAAPLSVTANTVLSSANAGRTGATEVMAEGEQLYLLITGTTGGSVTMEITSVTLTITEV